MGRLFAHFCNYSAPIRSLFGYGLARVLAVNVNEKIRVHLFPSVFTRVRWCGGVAITLFHHTILSAIGFLVGRLSSYLIG